MATLLLTITIRMNVTLHQALHSDIQPYPVPSSGGVLDCIILKGVRDT